MKQLLIIASRVLAAASKELENIANEVPTEDKPTKRGPGRPPKEKPAEPQVTNSFTGTECSVCGEPQISSAWGVTCANGHDRAPAKQVEQQSESSTDAGSEPEKANSTTTEPPKEISFIDLKNYITPLTKSPEAVKLKDYLKEKGAESLAKLSPLHYQGLWELATELKK